MMGRPMLVKHFVWGDDQRIYAIMQRTIRLQNSHDPMDFLMGTLSIREAPHACSVVSELSKQLGKM